MLEIIFANAIETVRTACLVSVRIPHNRLQQSRRPLDALATVRTAAGADLEVLDFLAPAGESNFKIELISAGKILRGAVERDESRHIDGQALFDIGRFQHGALDADDAMCRRGRKPDRGQRAGRAIRPNTGVDADAHILARRRLNRPFDNIRLRASKHDGCEKNKSRAEPVSYHGGRPLSVALLNPFEAPFTVSFHQLFHDRCHDLVDQL